MELFSLKLPATAIGEFKVIADDLNLSASALVRSWIMERLDAEYGRPTLSRAEQEAILAEKEARLMEEVRQKNIERATIRMAKRKLMETHPTPGNTSNDP